MNEPKGRDLLALAKHHAGKSRECPRCHANLSTVGLTRLLFVFDTCACDVADYAHLVEQLWHRDCFVEEVTP